MVAEMIEDIDWESDEAEDWESDEAFAEAEDSAEDIGERARRRRQQRSFRPGRGVQGLKVRRPGGGVQRVPFPAPLATAAETNRGLAKQEVARRALAERLNRLEVRARALQKNDSSISGFVTLTLGGGLTAFSVIQAAKKPGGSLLQKVAAEPSSKTAAVLSAAQLAATGAKLVINKRYHRSGIGMAADIFAAAQLGTFAFGSLHTPRPRPIPVENIANENATSFAERALVLDLDSHEVFEVIVDNANKNQFVLAKN